MLIAEPMSFGRDLGDGERDRRVLHIHPQVGTGVKGLFGKPWRFRWLVVIVQGIDDHRPPNRPAEIFDRHPRRIDAATTSACIVNIVVLIGDHRDADGVGSQRGANKAGGRETTGDEQQNF